MFEGECSETLEGTCASLLQSLPLVYSSLGEHQKTDAFCEDLRKRIQENPGDADSFQLRRNLLCYRSKRDNK